MVDDLEKFTIARGKVLAQFSCILRTSRGTEVEEEEEEEVGCCWSRRERVARSMGVFQ